VFVRTEEIQIFVKRNCRLTQRKGKKRKWIKEIFHSAPAIYRAERSGCAAAPPARYGFVSFSAPVSSTEKFSSASVSGFLFSLVEYYGGCGARIKSIPVDPAADTIRLTLDNRHQVCFQNVVSLSRAVFCTSKVIPKSNGL
jgi:hypothetical protein